MRWARWGTVSASYSWPLKAGVRVTQLHPGRRGRWGELGSGTSPRSLPSSFQRRLKLHGHIHLHYREHLIGKRWGKIRGRPLVGGCVDL